MRVGVCSYALPWTIGWDGWHPPELFEPEDLLDLATELGAEVVQFCDNLPIDGWVETDLERLDRLADRARGAGVSLEVGTRGLRPETLRRCIRAAQRVGCGFVRVVADEGDYRPDLQRLRTDLQAARPLFEDAGLAMALENHDRFLAEDLARIMEASGGWLKACFDTANSLGCLQGPMESLRLLLPHIVSLHLKDVRARRLPHGLGFLVEGAPAGKGAAMLERIFAEVAGACPGATAVLEQWVPKGADWRATSDAEIEWLREGWRTVRAWRAPRGAPPPEL
ncbi:MAG: sugar phosphate isomerase/epimerase family protein [Fimbriimonadaceae bacterium]